MTATPSAFPRAAGTSSGVEYKNGNGKSAHSAHHQPSNKGFSWTRMFGDPNRHPYDEIQWERRNAKITKSDGTVVFQQDNIEIPASWSQTATDIVASKYFRGKIGTPEREQSVRQMIDRVAKTVGSWGLEGGYFATPGDAYNFTLDLTWLLVNQHFAFNSPVWFNVGMTEKPQCSACFILAVDDDMKSIMEWYRDEGMIFKHGSGSGTSLSNLRSSREQLSKGGYSSGPVSFMKGADGIANTIRSGGATRRAAKMVVLSVSHPDIKDFIYCKQHIEEMTKILVQSGYQNTLDGDLFSPYTLLPYQNANNSVRVTDEFMRAVENNEQWELKAVTTGEVLEKLPARQIMDWVADAAWHSADPGMQYDTTINRWHTCPNTGRINASNPCSEYMHIDNSACNLASFNLVKFAKPDGTFDVDFFRRAVATGILAQEILVGFSSYPTEKIAKNAIDYRQLGMGYANLGALLMRSGVAYDSDQGRILAGQITSLMCGEAYRMSALVADRVGPYAGFAKNRDPQLNVISMHLNAAEELYTRASQQSYKEHDLSIASRMVWHEALEFAKKHGVRNSQVTVLAPTGTIGFLMDCDTTGVEPDIALVKYKKLVGGGTLKLVNGQVPAALEKLGYTEDQVNDITSYLMENDTIEGAPHLKDEDLPVFDCAFKADKGSRSISYMGHLRMMAAAQPFISGAISKTINLPSNATREDVADAFMHGWKLGLKAIAIYRDGSKGLQPLNTKKEETATDAKLVEHINGYTRVKLPDERPSLTHKFSVGGHEGYITVGMYPETGMPGEVFISIAKEGSTVSGLLNTIAILISMALQSGVPMKSLVRKFKDTAYAPAGFTENKNIPVAKSITDYVFRYMGMKFLSPEDQAEVFGTKHEPITASSDNGGTKHNEPVAELAAETNIYEIFAQSATNTDAPTCQCGSLMVRTGACYTCPSCGSTSGVCS
ncbi:MAG: vitamin B12-dependent ribonucleotide reductase [Patescibacteria group bacterium]